MASSLRLAIALTLAALPVLAQTLPADLPPDVRARAEQYLRERGQAQGTQPAATEATAQEAAEPATAESAPTPEQAPTPETPATVDVAETPAAPGATMPFGLEFFRRVPSSFAPIDYGPVDSDYRLGTGDEVLIDTWGEVELHYRPVVDRGGAITIPSVGRVPVAGLTLDETQDKLLRELSRYHASLGGAGYGRRSTLVVGLGKLRPITVFVLGEVARPGAYTLGATSTAFQALYAAGGPTTRGSLRRICRYGAHGAADTLDGYDYIVRGQRRNDIRLHHMDVVFIPVIGRTVEIRGAIRRPALFELRDGESFADLLGFAGGFRADVTPQFSQVERVVGSVRRLIDVSVADSATLDLNDGDILTVGAALKEVRYTVTVRGEVMRPQDYAWTRGMTVRTLLRLADGPTEQAYLPRADVIRLRPDGTTEVHAISIEGVLADPRADTLRLQPYDELVVRALGEFVTDEQVGTQGEVRKPGVYAYRQDMTLADLLFVAGGITPAAYTREVTIYRQYLTQDEIMNDTLRVILPAALDDSNRTRWPQVPLMPNDHVAVRRRPDWHDPALVQMTGEVQFPGVYQLSTQEDRIVDVLARAGGLTLAAYSEAVTVNRPGTGSIAVNLKSARKRPRGYDNLMLRPGDEIAVPKIPQTVTIKGAVGLETSVVHVPGERIGYYLDQAGGVLDSADAGRVRLVMYGGRVEKPKGWFRWSRVPPGSTIIVPTKRMRPETDWGGTVRDAVTFLGSLATTALLIIQVMK